MLGRLSLRLQLLISYLLLLVFALGVTATALLLFLSTRPAPPEPTFDRLAALMEAFDVRDLMQQFDGVVGGLAPRSDEAQSPPNPGNERAGPGGGDLLRRLLERRSETDGELNLLVTELLDAFSANTDVRVLWVFAGGEQQRVLYDSAEVFAPRDPIRLLPASYSSGSLQRYIPRDNQLFGTFNEPDGDQWLFGGVLGLTGRVNAPSTNVIMVAEPQSTVSLQDTLATFSNSLLPPLIQAGVVGGILAVFFAIVISSNIARPLKALARGASAVASGDLDEPVPESGPREVRAVAIAFNQMQGDVRAAQQAQRDFLASVSHDLKTPLTSIQGYSQAIMDGAARNPTRAARVIHDEASRLNRMVIELTDLMRIQSGRLSLKLSALDIGEMTAAIGQRMALMAREKNIRLYVETGPMPHIAGDGDRLAQVLDNLISNAIKYTPAGGEVRVKTEVVNGGVVITVQDDGIGIPPQDLPRIFDRFYQVDKARGPQRGTGLGLAITREIIEAHGGQISVDSAGDNQGSTFRVWLPSPQLSTIARVRV